MKFELIRNQEKASQTTAKRVGRHEFDACNGSTVCYHQPIYEQPFFSLQSAIHDGNTLIKLKGRYYKIESNGGYLHQYYPAVEYYKIAYRMIRDNIHTIRLSLDEIGVSQKEIGKIHRERKEKLTGGQTKLSFDKEIYQLRASIFTFVFTVRATLDTIASLFQTIYGPQIGQHTSFNGFMNHIMGEKCVVKDAILTDYLGNNMEWFVLLKDVRDYLAHFGSLHFSIKESELGALSIEIFRGIEVNSFISTVHTGFQELLNFLDNHCTNVVKSA